MRHSPETGAESRLRKTGADFWRRFFVPDEKPGPKTNMAKRNSKTINSPYNLHL